MKPLILLVSICAWSWAASAQEPQCPDFSGMVKNRLEKQARWLVDKSLQKQIAKRSRAFGFLVEFEQCHLLETGLLSLGDDVRAGPYFVADGVALKSMVGRHRGTWMMAVAPYDADTKMPDANLLEMTGHKWTLIHRAKNGSRNVLAAGNY